MPVDVVGRLLFAPGITVIVPVHDAAEEVERCLTSVLASLVRGAQVVVIDDASTDPAIASLLATFAEDSRVTVVTNEVNLGFVATVNRGFGLAGASDIVVLNSDTVVPPGWLRRLRLVAYSEADIGTVTPLSDNAGAFSAPEPGRNHYPDRGWEEIGRCVARHATRVRPESPTGHGFCMYVKRAVIDSVGGFDEASFPRGYGEENDLCMRAAALGWRHLIDDSTVVSHREAASFGRDGRAERVGEAAETLRRLHPDYESRVAAFLASEALGQARRRVGEALETLASENPVLPRVLIVLHGVPAGGTLFTTMDLLDGISDRYEPWILQSDGESLRLRRPGPDGELFDLALHRLASPVMAGQASHGEYRSVVAGMLVALDIEVVHVRHLIHHPLDVVELTRALGIPLVISLHDFYSVCPTIQLLDDRLRFCGARCTPGQGSCRIDWDWLSDLPHLKHSYVREWQAMFAPALAAADVLVTTAQSAKAVIVGAHPHLADADFRVVEHGRDLEQGDLAGSPQPGGRVRILVPGDVREHKGGDVIQALHRLDTENRLEFVVIGTVRPPIGTAGRDLGPYERDEFAERVSEIEPAFVGIFSVWAETYSHTLSEAWAAGVPVLAFDLGAVGERIRRHGGGWLLDIDDLEGSLAEILRIADDPDEYERGRTAARAASVRTVAQMAADYASLYDDVTGGLGLRGS